MCDITNQPDDGILAILWELREPIFYASIPTVISIALIAILANQ